MGIIVRTMPTYRRGGKGNLSRLSHRDGVWRSLIFMSRTLPTFLLRRASGAIGSFKREGTKLSFFNYWKRSFAVKV